MLNKKQLFVMCAGVIAATALAAPAFADTQNPTATAAGMHRRIPGVFGTVSAVNGTSITLTGKTGGQAASATTYTVDASNAKILKNGTSTTISNIAVGDTVMAQGTVNGSNVVATVIRDGLGKWGPGSKGVHEGRAPPQNPLIQGNGEPVIGGSVTSINGTTLTVTNKGTTTYTIDASKASILKMGTSTTISNVAIGDSVLVQGAVNGSSVTASSIIDQTRNSSTSATGPMTPPQDHPGLFTSIGNFFARLFGF